MQVINSNKAPKAIGPYSQAILANNFLFISGQIPIVPETMQIIDGGIKEQTKQCLQNIKAIIKEAGGTIQNIIKCSIFIKNMNDFTIINEIYSQFFIDHKPARVCVEVSRLPKDVLVEIDAVAIIKS